MKIYVAHSNSFNFQADLYEPLERILGSNHELILPQIKSMSQFESKDLFQNKGCEVIIAEVSLPSIGLGIELGWANMYGIPIICIHRDDSAISPALQLVSTKDIPYKDILEIQVELTSMLDELEQ